MTNKKNDPTLDTILALVCISACLLTACYLAKNISNKTAITNKPENTALTNKSENTPLPHVEKIIYIEKEEYNTSSDNILKELGYVALLFAIVLLFLMPFFALCFFKK